MTDTVTANNVTQLPNTLGWFEVATDDVDTATAFYGGLFGWTFAPFGDPQATGTDYRVASPPGSDVPIGGVTATGGQMPPHAVFYILVADVAATCDAAAALGGTVVASELSPSFGPSFAYLQDPVGSLFGVFTPPAM
jgi:predicted enzyme related to lactoylglutathione lyase